MPTLEALGIDRMSVDERLALVEAIWDSIAAQTETTPLTDAQKAFSFAKSSDQDWIFGKTALSLYPKLKD